MAAEPVYRRGILAHYNLLDDGIGIAFTTAVYNYSTV